MTLRVAIVHDYLTQRGGAERVVLAMLDALPKATLYTSVYDEALTFPGFRRHEVRTVPILQSLSPVRRDPRLALPALPAAFRRLLVDSCDVVLCSSSGWSHYVRSDAPKVVYCHNPARWLYQPQDYFTGRLRILRPALAPLMSILREQDRRAALSARTYLANSTSVAERIRLQYGRTSSVLHPPMSLDVHGPQEAVPEIEPGFLLTIGRPRGYKNSGVVEAALDVCSGERLVLVGGEQRQAQGGDERIQRLGKVSEEQLRWLYSNAKALVSVSREDFGLTPVEAFSFGTPAALLRAGGFLDTMLPGVTGVFIEEATPEGIATAVKSLPDAPDRVSIRRHAEKFSAAAFRAALHTHLEEAAAGAGGSA